MSQIPKDLPAYKRNAKAILCWRACANCHEDFPVMKKFPDARFCSRKCGLVATLPADHNARIARASARKRGDQQRGRGAGKTYRKLNGQHEHRVVAAAAVGRELLPGEVVHHVDGDKQNNRPENLNVLESQGKHARLHDSLAGRRARKTGTLIEIDGRKQNISAWAKEAGIEPSTLAYRLRHGWLIRDALGIAPAFGNRIAR